MKTYYELLGLDQSADAETIKKVFRHEIARYHPDKVQHLGPEFQDMAAERASQLTAAYKTLTDPEQRRQYDELLLAGPAPPPPAGAAPPPPAPPAPERIPDPWPEFQELPPDSRRFERDRAGRDVIVRRAVMVKVQGIVEQLYGDVQKPGVQGFDLALVPTAKARLLGTAPPRVLVRVSDAVDGAGITDAWLAAARAGVHAGKSPVVVLLFGHQVASQTDLQRALEQARRQKPPSAPEEIAVILVRINDWKARMAEGGSTAVLKLAEKLHA